MDHGRAGVKAGGKGDVLGGTVGSMGLGGGEVGC